MRHLAMEVLRRLRRRWQLLVCLIVGVSCGAVGLCFYDYVMFATSTPGFCVSCHEIERAYETWRTSSHASNRRGVVAECMDCHLPDPGRKISFYYSKAYHGTKDILVHVGMAVLGWEYDREHNRVVARREITNDRCQRCHQELIAPGMSRGAMLAHRSTLYPRKGYEKSCLQCHEDLVHKTAALFARRN